MFATKTGDGSFAQAVKLYEEAKYQEAFALAQELVGQGNDDAKVLLGWMHQNGALGRADNEAALRWYQAAAQAGSVNGLYALGNLHKQSGDHARAFAFYKEAAGKHHLPSLYNLGLMYEFGRGTSVQKEDAKKCYAEAAKGGHVFARRKIATDLMQHGGLLDKLRAVGMNVQVLFSVIWLVSRNRYDERTYE